MRILISNFTICKILFPALLIMALNPRPVFPQPLKRLNTVVELSIGESACVKLVDGETVLLYLVDIKIERDNVRHAVRSVQVKIEVDGKEIIIGSGNYHLPVQIGKVLIDCPVVKEYTSSGYYRFEGKMSKDARFRLWHRNSPFIQSGTFGFPLKQAWCASRTQSQNELAGLGWAENIKSDSHAYHATHDFGGAEGYDEIISATDGLIVSSKNEVLEGYEDLPGDVRPDVVWIVDGRGWYYRYSHLNSIEPEIIPGATIKIGNLIGYMGKQGGSGGWVHLHFGVHYKNQLTSKWETEDSYVYLWEAYKQKYNPKILAVARPKLITWTNEEIKIDGSKSISLVGDIVSFEWFFTDGSKAKGHIQKRKYKKAGEYSEVLKVTDSQGNISYDFQYIQVFDKEYPDRQIPTIHPSYYPSQHLNVNDPITFLVRTFGNQTGEEVWDFGDGTGKIVVNSGVIKQQTHNEGKYAEVVHTFSKPGKYVVRVERYNEFGYPAIGHLYVVVE